MSERVFRTFAAADLGAADLGAMVRVVEDVDEWSVRRVSGGAGGSAVGGGGEGGGAVAMGTGRSGERSKALESDGGVRLRAGVRGGGGGWNCEAVLASRGIRTDDARHWVIPLIRRRVGASLDCEGCRGQTDLKIHAIDSQLFHSNDSWNPIDLMKSHQLAWGSTHFMRFHDASAE